MLVCADACRPDRRVAVEGAALMAPTSTSHDFPYVEPERHDELSRGVPAARGGTQKREGGRFTPGPNGSAIAAGAAGGSRRKATTKLSHRIDAPTLTDTSQKRARTLRKALAGEIASTVGAGHCGIAASLFIKFAAQKTAAAEEAFTTLPSPGPGVDPDLVEAFASDVQILADSLDGAADSLRGLVASMRREAARVRGPAQ
jgi:hypothetical protein